MDKYSDPLFGSAKRYAANIAKALKGEAVYDERLMDLSLMKEMHWTWQELIDTPLHVILSMSFFNGRKRIFDNLQDLKAGNQKGKT